MEDPVWMWAVSVISHSCCSDVHHDEKKYFNSKTNKRFTIIVLHRPYYKHKKLFLIFITSDFDLNF